jgi:hypothetical protein
MLYLGKRIDDHSLWQFTRIMGNSGYWQMQNSSRNHIKYIQYIPPVNKALTFTGNLKNQLFVVSYLKMHEKSYVARHIRKPLVWRSKTKVNNKEGKISANKQKLLKFSFFKRFFFSFSKMRLPVLIKWQSNLIFFKCQEWNRNFGSKIMIVTEHGGSCL